MITKVQAINAAGSLLDLELGDVSDGYALEEIGGLGPVKATIVSSSYAKLDGSQYQSARREARNITFKIGLEPDYSSQTVQGLRRALYAYFMPKSAVSLKFFDADGTEYDIAGRVETCEPDIFTQEPMMNVSIINFDPDFLAPATTRITGNTTDLTTLQNITYPGTIEAGFLFTLNVNRVESDFTIYMTGPDNSVSQLDFIDSLLSGDKIEISTVPGNKYVQRTRGGVVTQVLYAVTPQSKWVNLQPGLNKIRVYTTGAAIPWTLDYVPRYGGL